MKKKMLYSFIILATIVTYLIVPQDSAFAEVADGQYNLNFQVLRADSDGVSIGNDYFNKPATLSVENGVKHVQITLNHSDYIKSLSGPNGAVSIVSENESAKTRVVKFKVTDISKPIQMNMHIAFNLEGMDYDQQHKARIKFDTSNLTATGGQATTNKKTETTDSKSTESKATGVEKVENPKTGDETPVAMLVLLLAASSIVLFGTVKSLRANK